MGESVCKFNESLSVGSLSVYEQNVRIPFVFDHVHRNKYCNKKNEF